MTTLAIRGHKTRGSEVIGLLEMLRGRNMKRLKGDVINNAYYISNNGLIYKSSKLYFVYKAIILEDFLEKFPYKVGDKVTTKANNTYFISEAKWNGNEIVYALTDGNSNVCWFSVNELQPYTEIKEGKMEEKNNNCIKWDLPEGYVFQNENGNVINATKILLVKKQPQYPKTYEECLQHFGDFTTISNNGYKNELIKSFYKLIICRDAYWKIAGDWKPTKCNFIDYYYTICRNSHGNIVKNKHHGINPILIFPTEEMRDAFYDNFKELIENVKELL